jgi:hypothetical protein
MKSCDDNTPANRAALIPDKIDSSTIFDTKTIETMRKQAFDTPKVRECLDKLKNMPSLSFFDASNSKYNSGGLDQEKIEKVLR